MKAGTGQLTEEWWEALGTTAAKEWAWKRHDLSVSICHRSSAGIKHFHKHHIIYISTGYNPRQPCPHI